MGSDSKVTIKNYYKKEGIHRKVIRGSSFLWKKQTKTGVLSGWYGWPLQKESGLTAGKIQQEIR